jgi:hypothetical protein
MRDKTREVCHICEQPFEVQLAWPMELKDAHPYVGPEERGFSYRIVHDICWRFMWCLMQTKGYRHARWCNEKPLVFRSQIPRFLRDRPDASQEEVRCLSG